MQKRSWVVLVLFIISLIFPPLGIIALILMWILTGWPKWLKVTLTLLLLIIPTALTLVYIFVAQPFRVTGDSMSPTYKSGTYLITLLHHQNDSIQREDVVIFKPPYFTNNYFIKRIVGLPSETIRLQDGVVYINGQKLDESKILSSDIKTHGGSYLKEGQVLTIPDKEYFVLSDNRANSTDSKDWGFVPEANILSKVAFCYWNCQ